MDINTSNNPNLVLHKYQVARLQIQAAQEILANNNAIINDLLAYAASLLSDLVEDGEEWS